MGAILLDGEPVAARIRGEVAERMERLQSEGITVGLGTVLVGDDVPSERYVALKHEDCASIGMYSVGEHLPAGATQAEVLDVIARFNADPKVSAFLVQLPLPAGLNEEQALLAVDPNKDVDGLHPVNLGRLVLGTPGPLPCTPSGIVELLHAYDVPVEGQPRRHHRPWRDHRPATGEPPLAQAPRMQRGRDDGAHRRRPCRYDSDGADGRHRAWRRRDGPTCSRRTWSNPAPPSSRPARASRGRS